jgi:hypothetical protein
MLIKILNEMRDQSLNKVPRERFKLIQIANHKDNILPPLKALTIANVPDLVLILPLPLQLAKPLDNLIKQRAHQAIAHQVMQGAQNGNVGQEDVQMGLLGLDVKL